MKVYLVTYIDYDKNDVKNKQTDNYRNGHIQKTVKSQYSEFDLSIPRDKNGEFVPKIVPKYKRDISGIEKKSFHFILEECHLGIFIIRLMISKVLIFLLKWLVKSRENSS